MILYMLTVGVSLFASASDRSMSKKDRFFDGPDIVMAVELSKDYEDEAFLIKQGVAKRMRSRDGKAVVGM